MSKLTLRCWLHLLSQVAFIRGLLVHGHRTTDEQYNQDLSREQAEIENALNDEIHAA